MELKTFFAQDLSGNAIPNPLVYLYELGTGVLATGLQTSDGSALSNPFSGSATGQIQFAAIGGDYDMRVASGIREYVIQVRFIDTTDAETAEAQALAATETALLVDTYKNDVLEIFEVAQDVDDAVVEAGVQAGLAAASANNALAVYGSSSEMQVARNAAASSADAAYTAARNASSVLQQDLSGVSEALHRSPNAVTAMFVYDTSKDSDGGAWTERCQHTSWYNEPVMGKWLGAQASETNARNEGATLGSELVVNGDFSAGVTGWTGSLATLSVVSGALVATNNVAGVADCRAGMISAFTTVVGRTYQVTGSVVAATGITGTAVSISVGTAQNGLTLRSQFVPSGSTSSFTFLATTTATFVFAASGLTAGGSFTIDNISVREVISQTTQSGDYFQRNTDGKFYKLNETSGITEVFRGNKRAFPKLAGIVAEAASVTIYDLTEAGRPMWMRFVAGSNFLLQTKNTGGVTSVAAANGAMLAGIGGGGGGLNIIDFPKSVVANVGQYWDEPASLPITSRSAAGTAPITTGSRRLANSIINAVALTTLPDAPIDPVTGLAVPTIAVATGGGVSVIKHNGTVVNSSSTSLFTTVVLDAGYLALTAASDVRLFMAGPVASLGASFAITVYHNPSNEWVRNVGSSAGLQTKLTRQAFAKRTGFLVQTLRHNESNFARSVFSAITNIFNTGHLIGDIRRAYLSDVDVGSVTGPELVVNGGFDSDTTGWSSQLGSTLSAVSGRLSVQTTSAAYGAAVQGISTVVGKWYQVTATVISSGGGQAWVVKSDNGTTNFNISRVSFFDTFTTSTPITRTGYFLATATTSFIWVFGYNGNTVLADNISVREVIPDRSYKAQAASITGTLTRSQVAQAAQLVAYSGFSPENYLREPYSADLDFGTSEWNASAWVNVPAVLPVGSFPVVGSELVTNGTFDTDTTGWSPSTSAMLSVVDGKLRISSSVDGVLFATTTLSTEIGKTYEFSFDLTVYGGTAKLFLGTGSLGNQYFQNHGLTATTGTVLFTATTTTLYITLALNSTSAQRYVDFDNISVKALAPALISDRAHASGALINVGITALGRLTATAFDGTTTRTVTTTAAYNTATWLKAEADYTTDGTLSISVNGVEVAATRGNPLLTLNNSNAELTIGNSYAADAPFPGSIALLKLSATAPTAEQALWMYEQEKQMFREGAQVTLPDAGAIADLAYDEVTDKWIAVSAANESEWSGLVRTSVTPTPAGSYSKIAAGAGVQMLSRITTNPGVDITIPAMGLRDEFIKRSEAAAKLNQQIAAFDYDGGFTATTVTGNTAITSVAGITYPVSYIGARVTGSGIPTDTFISAVSGTTIYLTKPSTASASAVAVSFTDFILPVGYTAVDVFSAGAQRREGATKDFTRLFDGFKETIRFGVAPGNTVWVQINAVRSAQ